MLTVKHEVKEIHPGLDGCNHLNFPNKANISWSEKKFTQQVICLKCGRLEEKTTQLVYVGTTFDTILEHFHGGK